MNQYEIFQPNSIRADTLFPMRTILFDIFTFFYYIKSIINAIRIQFFLAQKIFVLNFSQKMFQSSISLSLPCDFLLYALAIQFNLNLALQIWKQKM